VPLVCVNMGSTSHPEYHGGGLLPSGLDKTIQVTMSTRHCNLNLTKTNSNIDTTVRVS
jgi:hypothetical protein